MDGFEAGYDFFEKNVTGLNAAQMGQNYVSDVNSEIDRLVNDLNSFEGFKTKVGALKGDIAEFWHSDTFNINATASGSSNRTYVDRSHDFASADITSNFGEKFGLKYYKTGADSAKQQAKSIFERYQEYAAKGGKDSLDKFLADRGLDDIDVLLTDPIYSGQKRVIPKEQLQEAKEWLERKINEETTKRPQEVKRYKDTLDMLTDRLKDNEGNESISLSKEDAEYLAKLAKEGKISREELEKLGISTEDIITYEYILKQAFEAGVTAAVISMVLKVAPEIYKAIEYLIAEGRLDRESFNKIGFAALEGASEGFVRGTVSAAITASCKAGLCGSALKSIDPSIIGMATVLLMDTMKNSYKVAVGQMKRIELTNELIREMFVATCSLICGGVSQAIIEIPVLGFMIGSFVGSMVGSFTYSALYSKAISFCVDTGFTMFGLVDQDYTLPEDVLKQLGIDVLEYEKIEIDEFHPEGISIDRFVPDSIVIDNPISFTFLRRGVIGINKIGYVNV